MNQRQDRMRKLFEASGETPNRTMARSAKFAELARLYPEHFVAYREQWDNDRIVEPFVLAVAADEIALAKLLDERFPAGRPDGFSIRYVGRPSQVHVPTLVGSVRR